MDHEGAAMITVKFTRFYYSLNYMQSYFHTFNQTKLCEGDYKATDFRLESISFNYSYSSTLL